MATGRESVSEVLQARLPDAADVARAAKELGVSVATMYNWRSAHRSPDLEDLIQLARYLRMSTDELLGVTGISVDLDALIKELRVHFDALGEVCALAEKMATGATDVARSLARAQAALAKDLGSLAPARDGRRKWTRRKKARGRR